MENRIKDGNYYVVQSFMVKDYKLKGLEKDVYAIIYGFSQAENQWYDGSLQYLANWTNSTKQGVLKALSSLFEKQLIEKQDVLFNGVKFVKYRSTEFNGGIKQSLTGGIKQSLTNNIVSDNIVNIIEYLNENAGTNYRSKSAKTQTLIKARLNEGFTVEDFKKVIDNKVREWKRTEWEKYLRPETLFGTKFESYLNQKRVKKIENEREYTREEIKGLFADLEDVEL
jgi:uncharacterized phage protein (TIGR02220 family)